MGVTDLTNFRINVRFKLDNKASLGSTQLDNYINRAYRKVAAKKDHRDCWGELGVRINNTAFSYGLRAVAITAGSGTAYILPGNPIGTSPGLSSTLLHIKHARYIEQTTFPVIAGSNPNIHELYRRNWQEMKMLSVLSSGRPDEYAFKGRFDGIILNTSATTSEANNFLGLESYWQPANLTAIAHTTLLEDDFDEVVEACAAWFGWLALGQLLKAEEWRDTYALMLADAGVDWRWLDSDNRTTQFELGDIENSFALPGDPMEQPW